jgi:peptidyl-dipeptidase A
MIRNAFLTLSCSLLLSLPLVSQTPNPTPADAEKFVNNAETKLDALVVKGQRAEWVAENFITDDTQEITSEASETVNGEATLFAKQTIQFQKLQLPPELARKMMLLKLAAIAPSNAKDLAEMTRVQASIAADYGKGKYCPTTGKHAGQCLDITKIEHLMETSTDPDELKDLWIGWRTVGAPMRQRYARFVELSNKGAREMGWADTGAYWRAGYDMPPDQFSAELERLWQQVRPLYVSLHTYVRNQLVKKYGPQAEQNGMIRADLLGNPWAQEWGNIYPLVAPPTQHPQIDLTAILKAKKVDERGMVKYAEGFFTSLGFAPLPKTFWDRSLFVKPQDRDVICHASAWDVDNKDDLRLKACLQVRGEDFVTVHHELGHNFYQRAYKNQPPLFENGANDGFHEAIGDTIALSITPAYLKQVGLIDEIPQQDDIALLLHQALDKVAFLPFGLLIDQWRWKVFSGEIKPEDYNKSWWQMREHYQGVFPPVARTEAEFDPGAKYHVPANVPYTRYFLARILQFQFYRAMCKEAGHTGPLYTCSFYNNKQAGAKLAAMLEMGTSKPWPEELKVLTGEDKMDAGAMLDYFAPLKKWLDEQNKGVNGEWQETK